jgi:hypothetical protein
MSQPIVTQTDRREVHELPEKNNISELDRLLPASSKAQSITLLPNADLK